MYEQEYKRGQIYDIGASELLPGEQAITRPGLIVSSDVGNRTNQSVIITFLTTMQKERSINYGPIKATGKLAYVQCNQLQTVSKKRIGKIMGQLSENEMREVDKRLDEALDLGYVDDTPLKEKEKEIEILKIQLKELREQPRDEVALRVEADMWKGLYEKALDMLVGKKLSADLQPEPAVEANPEPPKEKEPSKLDINRATFDELRGIGFSANVALSLINGRPYKTVEELKKLPGLTAMGYGILQTKVCCVPMEAKPVKSGKVNVNTASVNEIASVGMGTCTASQIKRYQRKNGDFKSLDDLLKVPRFGQQCLKKYGKMLEV